MRFLLGAGMADASSSIFRVSTASPSDVRCGLALELRCKGSTES